MSHSFRASFEQMVEALRAHPKVEIYDVEIRPPASAEDIAAAEAALRRPMPDDLRAFYLAHDGVFLSWGIKGRPCREPLAPFGWPDYGAPSGVINLLPVRQVFSSSWLKDGTVNWTNDDHLVIYGVGDSYDEDDEIGEERIRAVVVDHYAMFHHADIVFGPVDRPAWTLIADDHGAEMMESNLSNFSSYLDIAIALWGTERMSAYKVARYKEPHEITKSKIRPTLEEVVAEAETD